MAAEEVHYYVVTAAEFRRVRAAARQAGLPPGEWVGQVVRARLGALDAAPLAPGLR